MRYSRPSKRTKPSRPTDRCTWSRSARWSEESRGPSRAPDRPSDARPGPVLSTELTCWPATDRRPFGRVPLGIVNQAGVQAVGRRRGMADGDRREGESEEPFPHLPTPSESAAPLRAGEDREQHTPHPLPDEGDLADAQSFGGDQSVEVQAGGRRAAVIVSAVPLAHVGAGVQPDPAHLASMSPSDRETASPGVWTRAGAGAHPPGALRPDARRGRVHRLGGLRVGPAGAFPVMARTSKVYEVPLVRPVSVLSPAVPWPATLYQSGPVQPDAPR